ncbi:hypothetical protein GcC1_204005 [Golovinomyces cichoracearum]|uniref:Uncharacterized protein n=1 Tax=Golovinomyces cichoracearum TaxID=62708 RepID=A0A420HD84_9PEZI|nr:hypothetical protein GcC1_204005 [Golovinomyces cichoracearum]
MATDTSSSISAFEMATDKLWRFQLRKENKAILVELQENERRRKSLLEANQKRFEVAEEKIFKLELKVAQLEKENLKNLQLWEKLKNEERAEMTELKMQLKLFLHSHGITADEELRTIMTGKIEGSSIVKNKNTVYKQKSTSISKKLFPQNSHSIQAHSVGENPQVERNHRLEIKESPLPKRFKTQGQKNLVEQSLPHHPSNGILLTKLPKLNQGRMQLKPYYEKAGLIRTSISSMTEKLDFDFVNTFIRGIASLKTRQKLISQLQQIYLSKQMKDGRVEILCNWTELGEAIKGFVLQGKKNGDGYQKARS